MIFFSKKVFFICIWPFTSLFIYEGETCKRVHLPLDYVLTVEKQHVWKLEVF